MICSVSFPFSINFFPHFVDKFCNQQRSKFFEAEKKVAANDAVQQKSDRWNNKKEEREAGFSYKTSFSFSWYTCGFLAMQHQHSTSSTQWLKNSSKKESFLLVFKRYVQQSDQLHQMQKWNQNQIVGLQAKKNLKRSKKGHFCKSPSGYDLSIKQRRQK